jgi:hypothetical protein
MADSFSSGSEVIQKLGALEGMLASSQMPSACEPSRFLKRKVLPTELVKNKESTPFEVLISFDKTWRPGGYARKLADAFGMRTFTLQEAQGSSDRARQKQRKHPIRGAYKL